MIALAWLLGCAPLSGTWSGEVECAGYTMPIELEIALVDGDYEGEGIMDCTEGYGDACLQTFDVQVDRTRGLGEQDLDVDLDDCVYEVTGAAGTVTCERPDDVTWDGGGEIEGELGACEFALERD